MKKDLFVEFLKEQMQAVVPASLKSGSFKQHNADREDFYEIICAKACLNPDSTDVWRAFIDLYPLNLEA